MTMYLKFDRSENPESYLIQELNRAVTLEYLNEDYYSVIDEQTESSIGALELVEESYYFWGN